MAQQPLSVVLLSCRIASAQELLPPFPLGSKDVGRSFWLVRLANGQTCGPASSISPAQSRPRALRRSTASDSTDTPVSQSRALARCRPVIKLPRGRGDVALWSGDARSSIPGARSRSTLYYWTTVRCSSSQERGEFVTDTVIPHAVCRLPFTYLPDSSVGFSHGSHGSCAGFAEESLPRRTRSAPRWSRVHSLKLSGWPPKVLLLL